MFQSYKTMIFRLLLTVLAGVFFSDKLAAQVIDYNQIVPPEGQRPTNFEDYLVQLAWLNNPETKILELEKSQEEKEVSLQKSAWADDLGLTFNMNEVSLANVLDDTKEDNLVLYPLYQFTATMKLGSFVNNRKKRDIEAVDVLIAEQEGNRHKLRIRAETLARYQALLLAIETLKVRTRAEEDARNTHDFVNQAFKTGDKELEDLLRSSEAFNNAVEKRLAAETDIQLAKLALEEMIGVKWEVAVKNEERFKK